MNTCLLSLYLRITWWFHRDNDLSVELVTIKALINDILVAFLVLYCHTRKVDVQIQAIDFHRKCFDLALMSLAREMAALIKSEENGRRRHAVL